MRRSISSARSQSRAKGAISRSQNSRADARTSSCSGVSAKSNEGDGAGGAGPIIASLASLDQRTELAEVPVRVADELDLGDREVITRTGLDPDSLEQPRVRPVHVQDRVHQRRTGHLL